MTTLLIIAAGIIGLILSIKGQNYQENQTPYYFLRPVTWLQMMDTGAANGYVAILDRQHPLFGRKEEYGNYDDNENYIPGNSPINDLNVHGGITWADYDEDHRAWVIGFDVCHLDDNKTNWPIERCEQEAAELLKQVNHYKV